MTRRFDLVILDWDGTLVDSIDRIVQSIWQAADSQGLPRREEQAIRDIIGLAMPEATRVLYPQLGDAGQIAAFQQCYAGHYLASEADLPPFYPGVLDTLAQLQARGYRLAVATGKSRRGLDRIMAGHGCAGLFASTRCADETASKPDPRMLHEILAECGVTKDRAVMVGDSVFDLQMASRAGMAGVGVSYGAQPARILAGQPNSLMIDHFAQLAAWLAEPWGTTDD